MSQSPCSLSSQWLEALPPAIANRICLGVALAVFEGFTYEANSPPLVVPRVVKWLNASQNPAFLCGRATAFRSVVQFEFGSLLDGTYFDLSERAFAELANSHEIDGFKAEFEKARAAIPQQRKEWTAIAPSWIALLQQHLTDEMLWQWRKNNASLGTWSR